MKNSERRELVSKIGKTNDLFPNDPKIQNTTDNPDSWWLRVWTPWDDEGNIRSETNTLPYGEDDWPFPIEVEMKKFVRNDLKLERIDPFFLIEILKDGSYGATMAADFRQSLDSADAYHDVADAMLKSIAQKKLAMPSVRELKIRRADEVIPTMQEFKEVAVKLGDDTDSKLEFYGDYQEKWRRCVNYFSVAEGVTVKEQSRFGKLMEVHGRYDIKKDDLTKNLQEKLAQQQLKLMAGLEKLVVDDKISDESQSTYFRKAVDYLVTVTNTYEEHFGQKL